MDSGLAGLRGAAGEFVDSLVTRLEQQGLLPLPPYRSPFLDIGTDYFGIGREAEAGQTFESEIESAFPDWFGDSADLATRRVASVYTYSFAQLCIAEAHRRGDDCSSIATSFDTSFDRLICELKHPVSDSLACRLVWHVCVAVPVQIGGVSITPVENETEAAQLIIERLPRARSVMPVGKLPSAIWSKGALLEASAPGYENLNELGDSELDASKRIERLLLSIRLRWAATAHDAFEVKGPVHLIGGYSPSFATANSGSLLRRTASIANDDVDVIEEISTVFDTVRSPANGVVVDPLVVALNKFTMSHQARGWWDHVVDLMTGIEASLSGQSRDAVALRIKSRAAVLLATESDSPEAIFDDLTRLYDLRSSLVHGAEIKDKTLAKAVRTVVPSSASRPHTPEDVDRAVDRLRDLLRRSILARVALSFGPSPRWASASKDTSIDKMLVNGNAHHAWREDWHGFWEQRGAAEIWRRPSPAQSWWSRGTVDGCAESGLG